MTSGRCQRVFSYQWRMQSQVYQRRGKSSLFMSRSRVVTIQGRQDMCWYVILWLHFSILRELRRSKIRNEKKSRVRRTDFAILLWRTKRALSTNLSTNLLLRSQNSIAIARKTSQEKCINFTRANARKCKAIYLSKKNLLVWMRLKNTGELRKASCVRKLPVKKYRL
jgi:hypothetical protein